MYIIGDMVPILVKDSVPPSFIVCTDEDRIHSNQFPSREITSDSVQ